MDFVVSKLYLNFLTEKNFLHKVIKVVCCDPLYDWGPH